MTTNKGCGDQAIPPRSPEQPPRPRGRRAGGEDTRGAIIAAARTRFAADGYDKASLRAIARAASVDAALVHHYFDDKAALFAAAMDLPVNPREVVTRVLGGDPGRVGERLASNFFDAWDSPAGGEGIQALLRSAVSHDEAARMLREFFSRELFGRVAVGLGVPDADLRAALAASQMVGLAMMRYVLRLEPVASAPVDQLVAWIAPTLQRYLTAPAP